MYLLTFLFFKLEIYVFMKHFMNFLSVWSDGVSEVCRFNLPFPPSSPSLLLDQAALPVFEHQGAVLNEVSLPVVTFCPLRLTAGAAAVLSG